VERPLSAYRRLESAMTKKEFVALLKLQDRQLMMCDVTLMTHKTETAMYSADVLTKNGYIVMEGPPAKTRRAAVQRSIAKYYKS
jgi:hypothetical protein